MVLYLFLITQATLSIYNRKAGDERHVNVTGQIIDKEKFKSHGRTRYYFEIRVPSLKRNIEIKVDEDEYQKLKIGDVYSTDKRIGALGLIYSDK
jgi:hypothetical protein